MFPWNAFDGNTAPVGEHFRRRFDLNPSAGLGSSLETVVDGTSAVPGLAGQRSLVMLFPNRDPLANVSGAFEGSERWYRSRLYFPAGFRPSPDTGWNWVLVWHNWPNSVCCGNLSLSADTSGGGERLSLRVMGGGDPDHPVESDPPYSGRNPATRISWYVGDPQLKRDHWYDVLVHVKWSWRPGAGIVEWWLDGRPVMSRVLPTLFWYAQQNEQRPELGAGPGQAYLVEGYYRPAILPNGTWDNSRASVVHADTRIGPTRASVGASRLAPFTRR